MTDTEAAAMAAIFAVAFMAVGYLIRSLVERKPKRRRKR